MKPAPHQIEAILRAIDFAEDNLTENIDIAAMAGTAAYSLFHFCRVFVQVTHHTPFDYLIRRRLTQAAQSLLVTDTKIITIAHEYGFGSPEVFARAFRRLFGILPSEYRNHGRLIPGMHRITPQHLGVLHDPDFSAPEIISLPASSIVGLGTLCRPVEALSCGQSLREFLPAPKGPYTLFLHTMNDSHTHCFLGVPGIEVTPPFSAMALPAGDFVGATCPPDPDRYSCLCDILHNTWAVGAKLALLRDTWRIDTHVGSTGSNCSTLYIPVRNPASTEGDIP